MAPSLLESRHVTVMGDITANRVVVFSHGFGLDQSCWQLVVPQLLLDQGLKIVLLDLACASSSFKRDEDNHDKENNNKNATERFDYDRYNCLEAFASDLLDILDSLQIKKCFYVGHSMSAMIGCIAAIQRPDLFEKLILLGASPRYLNDWHNSYCGGFEAEDLEQLFESMEKDYGMWVASFAPLAVGADLPAAVGEFRRTLGNMNPAVALHVAKIIFQTDYRDILPAITVPCHVIQTANDFAVPGSVAEYLCQQLGGHPALDILDTQGHLPQITAPSILVSVLKSSLSTETDGHPESSSSMFLHKEVDSGLCIDV